MLPIVIAILLTVSKTIEDFKIYLLTLKNSAKHKNAQLALDFCHLNKTVENE
jgi:hypothetical protein